LVLLLINLLTPPELLQFYLSDSGARIAVAEARLCQRFDATACASMQVMIIVDGEANTPFQARTKSAAEWLSCFSERLTAADTHRNEMAFWTYSSCYCVIKWV
jgi:hypothetical protein